MTTKTKAPRASLSGVTVSFGLVSFSVDVVPAAAAHSGGAKTSGPKTKLVCPKCKDAHLLAQVYQCTHDKSHTNFTKDEADRAIEKAGGSLTRVDKDVLTEALAPEEQAYRLIDLRVFPADQVEAATIPTGTAYRLRPGKGADQPYALVMRLLESPSVAFLCEVTQRSVTRLFRATVRDGMITLAELCRPEDLYEPVPVDATVPDALVAQGEALVQALTEQFDPAAFADKRSERLVELAASLTESAPATPVPEIDARSVVDDLTAVLERSMQAAQAA
jgi:non-homologous end joining protein Ku